MSRDIPGVEVTKLGDSLMGKMEKARIVWLVIFFSGMGFRRPAMSGQEVRGDTSQTLHSCSETLGRA